MTRPFHGMNVSATQRPKNDGSMAVHYIG